MYSVERFYETPLVSDVVCMGGLLNFTAHNVFKQNAPSEGVYKVFTEGTNSDAGDAPDHPCAVDLPLNRAFVGVADVEEALGFIEESAAESLGSMPASSSSARIAVVRIASSATAATRASVARRAA